MNQSAIKKRAYVLIGVDGLNRNAGQTWADGPLPSIDGASALEDERRHYLASWAADLLYGPEGRRFHQRLAAPVQFDGGRVTDVELIELPDDYHVAPSDRADNVQILALHVLLAGRDAEADAAALRSLRLNPAPVLTDLHFALGSVSPRAARSAFSFLAVEAGTSEARETVAWEYASGLPQDELAPSALDMEATRSAWTVSPSRSWDLLVLRDGACLVFDRSVGEFEEALLRYTGSIYLDVFAFALIERLTVETWVAAAAAVEDPGYGTALDDFELGLVKMKRGLQRRDIATGVTGNQMLQLYQTQHGLARTLEFLTSEVEHFARVVSARREEATNLALGTLAVVGLPLAAALQIWSTLFPHAAGLAVALVSALGTSLLVLMVLPSFRRRLLLARGRQPSPTS